jgi:alpha-galactosidase
VPKISIIGAGSGAFSLSLIRDICLTKNLEGSIVSFMDIDPNRLEGAYAVCQRFTRELGFNLRLEKTLVREETLAGADFVINTALAAPHHRLREGWEIARKYGYNWGGSFNVFYDEAFWIDFYQLKLFESIYEDAHRICPDAYHLMVANPVLAGVTHMFRKFKDPRLVGLCHGFSDVYHIADALGLDREHLTFEIPGVNHFVWLTHCYYRGENVFPMIDRWLENEAPKRWEEGVYGPLSPKTASLYRRFGAIPIGDTAHWSGACWPWYYHSDAEVEKSYHEVPEKGWDDYFTHVTRMAAEFNEIANNPAIQVTGKYETKHSGEPMVPIIESIACDIPRVVIGNIQNTYQYVPGIPSDFEVEIPILFSKRGMQGIHTQGLPAALLAHTLRDRVAPTNLELAAFEQGSKDLLLQLILTDPWSRSEKQARAFLDEILALPYHEEMRQHYQ